jgi:AcrR family transcriptional regulator
MRDAITGTAMRLFLTRGFDRVTVAEIAREAEVAEQTVFNYFPVKEDLVYWRLESFKDSLLQAMRERPVGESVLSAFRRIVVDQHGLLAEQSPEAREQLVAIGRMITESPALLSRERRVFDGYADALTELLLADEDVTANEVQARVTAQSLVGVHHALVDYVRRRTLSGGGGPGLRDEVRDHAEAAFSLLEHGLENYGVRRDGSG